MHSPTAFLLAGAGLLLAQAPARADQLIFTFDQQLNIQALNLQSIGDLAFEDGAVKLWLCDGSTGGLVHEINPVTGAALSSFDPAAIPGLDGGPDALAILSGGTANLIVLSNFGESEGGRVTQTGTLVNDYGAGFGATGADVDTAGNLWIATGTALGGGAQLKRINPSTGVILQTVTIGGSTSRVVDVTFDPHTGACYCLFETTNQLTEINLSTGAQVSSVDLSPFLLQGNVIPGGLDFDNLGAKLYVGTGVGAAADALVVLRREYALPECDGSGVFIPCPCGNSGQPGRGCENSFGTGGGFLSGFGIPNLAADTFTLHANGLPPTTSALFFQGTVALESTPIPFGDGLLCIGGASVRLATKLTTNGTASFPSAGDPDLHIKGNLPSFGGTRFYQVWYRNPVGGFCTADTFNLTNAIKVYWAP